MIFSRMLYQLSYLATGGITTIGELVASRCGEFNQGIGNSQIHKFTNSPTHQFSRSYRVVYSDRKAPIGSTPTARIAGSALATSAMAASSAATTMKVGASVVFT